MMKTSQENTQEPRSETSECIQQESGIGGEATINDNRPSIAIQRKLRSAMSGADETNNPIRRKTRSERPVLSGVEGSRRNNTGLPNRLKSGIENLSGYSMDDVKVHYNSHKPAQLKALAYAQGTDIHLAPGQEKHLPHEAWHVVQQKQGRVMPTMQFKGRVNINDDEGLEKEADVMGAKAAQHDKTASYDTLQKVPIHKKVTQRLVGYEIETKIPVFNAYNNESVGLTEKGKTAYDDGISPFLNGGLSYGQNYGEHPEGRFHISADHNILWRLHRKLINKLIFLGLLEPNIFRRSMANLEYITPPRPELGQGSIKTHELDITAVKEHLNESVGLAKSPTVSELPFPGLNVFTGVPRDEIITWVTKNGIDEDFIIPDLDHFQAAINDSVSIQQTSGIFPQDIPEVFDTASQALLTNQNKDTISEIMAEVLTRSNDHAQRAFDGIKGKPNRFSRYRAVVIGYMSLISGYILADNLSFLTNFAPSKNPKNLFPFLSKTSLEKAKMALPLEVRPGKKNKTTWGKLTGKLIELANDEASKEYWATTYNFDIDTEMDSGEVFPLSQEFSMVMLSKGVEENNIFKISNVGTGNPLDLDDPLPKVAEGMEKAKTKPNLRDRPSLNYNFGKNPSNIQSGIPLEDRYMNAQYSQPLTASNMEGLLKERFKKLTGLQIKYLPEEEREIETAIAKEEVSEITYLQQRVELLSKKVGSIIKDYKELSEYLEFVVKLSKDEIRNDVEKFEHLDKDFNILKTASPEEQKKVVEKEWKMIDAKYDQMLAIKIEVSDEGIDKKKDKKVSFAAAKKETMRFLRRTVANFITELNNKNINVEALPNEGDQKRVAKNIQEFRNLSRELLELVGKMDEKRTSESRIKMINMILNLSESIKSIEELYNDLLQPPVATDQGDATTTETFEEVHQDLQNCCIRFLSIFGL